MKNFIYDDGGRSAAGFKGEARDCVTRAIAIATGQPYKRVYNEIFKMQGYTPRNGVFRKIYEKYLKNLGWSWKPTMLVGQGCKVHLKKDELPDGTIIVRLSRHLAAVQDGVVMDTFDCTREGRRCVYGYFYKEGH
jgi:hypothetical protein